MAKTQLICLSLGLLLVGFLFFPLSLQAQVEAAPTSLKFGSVDVNTESPTATVVVTNDSRQSVTIEKVTSSSAEFIVVTSAMPIALAPRSSTSFQVVFEPNAAGNFSGSITLSTNHRTGGISRISVSGTGIGATPTAPSPSSPTSYVLSASASSLSFSSTPVGSSASQAVVLTNTGTGSVSVSQVALSGTGFTVSGFSGGTTLAASQSLTLTVGFAPASAGSATGSLSVVSNATNSPATISLSGTGIQPQISVTPTSVSFGNVIVGVANTQSVTIQNPGTASLSVTQATLAGTGFSLTGLTVPLIVAAGGSSTFTVGFTPASASGISGSLTLMNNTTNSPLVIPLAGTGIASAPASYSVTLTWTPSSSSDSGFNVYRGSQSGGPYAMVNSALISTPTYTDTTVVAGQTYYYVATEVDSTGMESAYSSEISVTIP